MLRATGRNSADSLGNWQVSKSKKTVGRDSVVEGLSPEYLHSAKDNWRCWCLSGEVFREELPTTGDPRH